MVMTRRPPLVVATLLTCLLGACGTRYADPIVRDSDAGAEACSVWTTESDCNADTTNGCSFQPNVVGCRASDPSCPEGVCRSGDPFVRRSGSALKLHGAPYAFVGTVSWGIAWDPDDCRVLESPDAAVERTFDDLVAARVSVLKIWAFQSFAGDTGSDYSSFERIVRGARRAGIRLIFVLENHHQDCTRGATRDDAWYQSGYAAPYDGYALSLPDYARGLASRFRNEPTVLAWEVMHEARSEEFAPMDAFAEAMTTVLAEADQNHLIALGVDNGDSPGTSREGDPSNYFRLHARNTIDLLDTHDFANEDTPLPEAMTELVSIAASLGRPLFAGATAVMLDDASATGLSVRASRVETKLEAAFGADLAGFLVYDYVPDWTTPTWSFDGRGAEPLAGPDGVLARHAPPNR